MGKDEWRLMEEEMESILYWKALNMALDHAMETDSSVFVLGEDIGLFGGAYRVTEGLFAKYGEWRIRDTPISENSFIGLGVGAAMAGMRPVVEIMTVNFALLAMDALINMASMLPVMSGGQFRLPLVVRMPGGIAHQLGAQHSQRLEAMFMGIPGLTILVPSNPQDAYWQLIQAIRHDSPVLFIEHELLYFTKGHFDWGISPPPMDKARRVMEGESLTLVSYGGMMSRVLEAAKSLADSGIGCDVVDLRSLNPLDLKVLITSVEKTHRLLVVEESPLFSGVGSEIISSMTEACFYFLDAPPKRLGSPNCPVPYNKSLENLMVPSVESIVDAGKRLVFPGE
jgi:pyruvate dehydrogenase E1 component beta subunit